MLGTSVALLALPPFIEWQRMEMEESMNMQKKQVCMCPCVCTCMCKRWSGGRGVEGERVKGIPHSR